ncbi:hypothetical protein AC790_13415 [Pantoea sp. RIT-PI-b]|uniref:hypothetical protein n=1 Tax=Pantoea sp. RIT-PI-b TaxID=1681195 RepID=UPI0006762715|nr:hypothetical protein [Pantoea sp. RIT-PI-b]KNC11562.1 hypothetical protein AC790_13415 [Pantoea sp. RIT-PI-b]
MNKPIAEVARSNIHLLKEMQSAPNIGLSMCSELFLQALEIALPVLEQKEMITDSASLITDKQDLITDTYLQIENDGWIEWEGGKCPEAYSTEVQVKYRDGMGMEDAAGNFSWTHDNEPDDIIAYRIV